MDCIFVLYFTFLTVLTVNFCFTTAKFRTDTCVDHVQYHSDEFSCSKIVNGYHKVGLAAVLSFCWMLLHLEAEQTYRIHTILKDTKYCIEAASTLKREKNSRGPLKNGEQVTIKTKTRVWRTVVAYVKPESPPKPKKRTAVEKCATAMMVTSDVVLASFPAHEGDPVTEPSTIIPSTRTPVTQPSTTIPPLAPL